MATAGTQHRDVTVMGLAVTIGAMELESLHCYYWEVHRTEATRHRSALGPIGCQALVTVLYTNNKGLLSSHHASEEEAQASQAKLRGLLTC